MLKLTLHVPDHMADDIAGVLEANAFTINIVRLRGACTRPDGDAISCMLPREATVSLLDALRAAGFDEHVGSFTFDERLTVLGDAATSADRRAVGAPGDALLWPVLRAATNGASELSINYLVFMVLATMLAGIGLLTSSSVLIVGAMILGPEFGALAHICVSALGWDVRGVLRGAVQLVVGFIVAIAATALLVFMLDSVDLVQVAGASRDFERAIVSATWIGLVVACIAGMAGVLTLTSAKGEALIGVLVSVTTIPAAADVSIGIAAADAGRVGDGAATLLLNLSGMAVSGAATLFAYRQLAGPSARRAIRRARRRTEQGRPR